MLLLYANKPQKKKKKKKHSIPCMSSWGNIEATSSRWVLGHSAIHMIESDEMDAA